MSMWAYVKGLIDVQPIGRTQEEKEYTLKSVLRHLPRVTGSEHDMYVYINQKQGINHYSSHDEFENYVRGGWHEMQMNYWLIVEGSLRDRDLRQTFKEFVKWLTRLATRQHVNSVSCEITGYDVDLSKPTIEEQYQEKTIKINLEGKTLYNLFDSTWVDEKLFGCRNERHYRVEKAMKEFRDIYELKENWDKKGAKPFDVKLIDKSAILLDVITNGPTKVKPNSNGSIEIEFESEYGEYVRFNVFPDKIETYSKDF